MALGTSSERSGSFVSDDCRAAHTEAKVCHLMTAEYARHASDVVWRMSKLGLRMTGEQVEALEGWMRGVGV